MWLTEFGVFFSSRSHPDGDRQGAVVGDEEVQAVLGIDRRL